MAHPNSSTTKIMENMEKTNLQEMSLIETGLPGDSNLEDPLGPFLQAHDNHCTWHWEQTGTTSIVENTIYPENTTKSILQPSSHNIKSRSTGKTSPTRFNSPCMDTQPQCGNQLVPP
jgi:hypothetical protein